MFVRMELLKSSHMNTEEINGEVVSDVIDRRNPQVCFSSVLMETCSL